MLHSRGVAVIFAIKLYQRGTPADRGTQFPGNKKAARRTAPWKRNRRKYEYVFASVTFIRLGQDVGLKLGEMEYIKTTRASERYSCQVQYFKRPAATVRRPTCRKYLSIFIEEITGIFLTFSILREKSTRITFVTQSR